MIVDQSIAGGRSPRDADLPLYGATFTEAVVRFVKGAFRYRGRASRSEYWWAALAQALLPIAYIACAGVGAAVESDVPWLSVVLENLARVAIVAGLLAIIPMIAVGVRRLHDANRPGPWLLCIFVPLVGWTTGIVVGLLESDPAGARFDARADSPEPARAGA